MCSYFLLMVLVGAVAYGQGEPWNFTPKDFQKLRSEGKALSIAADSQWYPKKFEKTFLETLKFILAEDDGVVRTTGVRMRDFYHCHFLCKQRCHGELETRLKDFNREFDRERRASLGDDSLEEQEYDLPITPENLPALVEVLKRHDGKFNDLVEEIIKNGLCERPAVLCHTFEEEKPKGMRYGDPRRNILAYVGESPGGYTPPDIDYASSYTDEFCHLGQFSFLMDQRGQVHTTLGVDSHLVRFTGFSKKTLNPAPACKTSSPTADTTPRDS